MAEAVLCPQCGKAVPADAPQGLCPVCMMQAGLPSDLAEQGTIAPAAPSTQEAATLPPQTPARPGEETIAPPEANTHPASSGSGAAPNDVPGYEILGELGRGGMGVVYKAKHKKLGRLVALKMILAGGHAGETDLARFRTEAEAIARVKHAHIIQIYEIGDHDGKPYFSLEFCAGGSLAQKIDGTPMQPKDAARLVEKLARAMEAAHQEEIIHRDLKPANVLLMKDGTPKITDFGLAKKLDDAGQTHSGAIMGTPSYMAPEQAEGKAKQLGPPADIYALGAILYELLTGRPPFKAATPLDTILQVVSNDPVPPSQLQTKMPRDIETICMKCLQKDPAKRYASAKALADDLRHYQKGEPIHARPVSNMERAMKWVKRRPMVAGLIAAVVLFAFIAFTGISGGLGWALVERGRAIEQEKKTAKARKQSDEDRKKAQHEKSLADIEREKAETLALRIQFEHYFAKIEDRPDLALVGLASLLPKAALLKNQRLANSLRLHVGAVSERAPRLTAMWGLSDPSVALSADGKTALTPSGFHTSRLWDTATGKPIGPPMQHQREILGVVLSAVALSADGKTALTADYDAQVWDTATGKPIGPLLQHLRDAKDPKNEKKDFKILHQIRSVALSADGKTALTAGDDGTARLWNTATGKPIGVPVEHNYFAVALSTDGKTALIGGRLWDTATGKPIESPLQHQDGVRAVALSADGKTLLMWRNDNTARLWETATGKPIGPPLAHQAGLTAAALSVDGRIALTATKDNTARMWDTASGKPVGSSLQHQSEVSAVALSADGKTALTGSRDGAARSWKPAAAKPSGPALQGQQMEVVFAVALSADGKMALTASGGYKNKTFLGEVQPWDTATGKASGPPLQYQEVVGAVALSADGKTALTAGRDKTARLWETATGKPIGQALQHQSEVRCVALSADGKTALTAGAGVTALLWDTASGKPIGAPLENLGSKIVETDGNISTRRASVHGVALNADGKMALTADLLGTVQLFDTATGKPTGPRLQDQIRGRVVGLSGDGKTALSGNWGNTARLWETASGKPIGPPLHHQAEVDAVALSADGMTALTGSKDKTARLWETATGKPIGPPLQHQSGLNAVALSADGKTALTGSHDKMARLWYVPQPLRGDPERIMLWAQMITGLEVDELTTVRFLDPATWQQRRQQLNKLGGPPKSD